MFKLSILIFCLLFFSSCSDDFISLLKNGTPKEYTYTHALIEPGTTLLYDVVQKDKDRTLNYQILLTTKEKDNVSTPVSYRYYYSDKKLDEKEKKLYINTEKGYVEGDERVDDTNNELSLNIANDYSLEKLQLAPDPYIYFPIKRGADYTRKMGVVGDSWGIYDKKTVVHIYDVEEIKESSGGDYIAYIKAYSRPKYVRGEKELETDCNLMKTKADFVFDSKVGFTKMNYVFEDGTSVSFSLLKRNGVVYIGEKE